MQITEEPNAAQRLLQSLGIATATAPRASLANKNASATRSGPGRYAQHGTPGTRIGKARPMRAYRALMAASASKRVTKAPLRDERGAYTLIGKVTFAPSDHLNEFDIVPRRKWLAGISAQRGY